MVDAIRVLIGLDPLYRQNSDTLTERMYQGTSDLPDPALRRDWFVSVAVTSETRESFRNMSVRRAEKRRALKFEEARKRGQQA